MKLITVLSVAIIVCVACIAPSAWAGGTATETTPGTESAFGRADHPAPQAPGTDTAVQRCPATLEQGQPPKLPATCSFGAPPCSYNGQCTAWCWPMNGLCISGCCACKP